MESSVNSTMISAIRHGNVSTVSKLIGEHGLSCEKWSGGYNLLLEALQCKHIAVAKLLLSNGAEVNAENSNIFDPSPLYVAVAKNEKEIVEILLKMGADINVEIGQGQCTPLHVAIRHNNVEMTELLLQNGALTDISNLENKTPLKMAVEKGFVDIVEMLLQSGANVNFVGHYLKSSRFRPLHVACENGHKDIVELLLSSGAEVNAGASEFCTPLHIAVEKGFTEIVEVLLKRGAHIGAQTAQSYSPLHIAVKESHKDIVDLLLKMGAPVDVKAVNSVTPLHLAVQKGDMDIIAMLLDNGANINAKVDDFYTPLHTAVGKARKDIVEFLLSRGADVNTALADSRTPLHTAIGNRRIDIVELLLRHGANANAEVDCCTPLHIAVQDNSSDVNDLAELLLNNGADVNAKTRDSITPLHISIKNNRSDLVQLLLERGADVDSEDKDASTALCVAVKYECPIILDHVLKFRPDFDNRTNQNIVSIATRTKNNKAQIIKRLLEHGFFINPEVATNSDIISCVIENGFVKIADEIFKYGTDTTVSSTSKPLHVAAVHGQLEVAEVLLKHGADINARDVRGKAPIYFATANGDLRMFQWFLANGAVLRDPGELLCVAAKSGCLEIVKTLVNRGCDVNCEGERGQTALQNTSIAVERPSTVTGFPRYLSNPRLSGAVSDAHVQVAEYLLQNGANVNARDHDSDTPLLTAARNASNSIAEILLKHGADVNAVDRYGESALDSSVLSGCLSLTQLLLEKGAKVNAGSEGRFQLTPLHIATVDGDIEQVKILLEYGADVNAICKDGTPIHIATRKSCLNLVKLLLEYGADVNVQCRQGTALHIASSNGDLQVAEVLLEYGADVNIASKENSTPLECAPTDYLIECYHGKNSFIFLLIRVVKLAAARLYVSERNLRFLETEQLERYLQRSSILPKKIAALMSRAQKEIEILKYTKIAYSDYTTYHDILSSSPRQIMRLLGNDTLLQTLNKGDYRDIFPVYASMISSRFELAKRRRQLEEESKRVFFYVYFPSLPHMCIDRIVHYSTDGQLMLLIRMCCPENCLGGNME